MYKLSATDHRTGAFGDAFTAETRTIEGAHAMAAELHCGIYSITYPDGIEQNWESDGTPEGTWTF